MINIIPLLVKYGYIVLFVSMCLELIALPLPGELLMSYTGYLVFKGQLGWETSILVAFLGASTGVTISYWVGYKLGTPFFYRYGHIFHMGPDNREKVSQWFSKFGNNLLVVAYFIPGVRHISGYFSGLNRLPFRTFAFRSYLGAFLWVGTFISLGKIMGPKWKLFHGAVSKYLITGGIVILVLLAAVYLFRSYKANILEALEFWLGRMLKIFRSRRRVKFLIGGAAIVFLAFFLEVIGLVQDYLANEFGLFDRVSLYIIHTAFGPDWAIFMKNIARLGTLWVMALITVAFSLWLFGKRIKGLQGLLEPGFLVLIFLGGILFEVALRKAFHLLPAHTAQAGYNFPSGQSLLALSLYGFIAFLMVRHHTRIRVRSLVFSLGLIIALLVGTSYIYTGLQKPSAVAAGYVFGGLWLSLNVFLMEVFRILPDLTKE